MKKLLLLSFIILSSCAKDDNCNCKGKFGTLNGTFYSNNVDCETGEPVISQQQNSDNPAYFIGCDD